MRARHERRVSSEGGAARSPHTNPVRRRSAPAGLEGPRRPLGDMGGPLDGRLSELIVGHHLVHGPELQRLGRGDRPPVKDHFEALRRPDQSRESGGTAGARNDPEADLGLPVGGGLAGDSQITGPREFGPAAPGLAVVHGDRDHRSLGDLLEDPRHRCRDRLPGGRDRPLPVDDELQRPPSLACAGGYPSTKRSELSRLT